MLPLVVGATPIDNLVLSAIPNVEIKGQIPTLPSGIAISQLLLLSADGSIHDSNTSVKDGAFDFRSVPPGEYILSLPLGQQVYVDSVSVGGKSSGSSRFTIAPGQDTVNLELEVKKSRAQIRGSVKEWQSAAASAEVIAQSEDSGDIYKVTTDKQKNFSFAGVKPGEYRLFAWPGVDTIEYRNPLVLKKYNNDSTEVRVDQDDIGSVIELSPIEKER
jgi:Polysaccharide lyase family 4, domain II